MIRDTRLHQFGLSIFIVKRISGSEDSFEKQYIRTYVLLKLVLKHKQGGINL